MKIVIVGGGTAGWISALYISYAQKGQHDITVIESSALGIIGTGEGSTGALHDLLNGDFFPGLHVDITDFMNKTDATYKYGINNVNWTGDGSSYFSPIDISPTANNSFDYIFRYALYKFGNQNVSMGSRLGIKYSQKMFDNSPAMHFDGHKVGEYLKSLCAENNVKSIDAIVKDVSLDTEGNVKELTLDDGSIIHGDFFLDCSGFARLINKKVGSTWKSCKKDLSLDTGLPFIVQYKPEDVFVPETTSTALSSGWMFNIPLTTRRGMGYVFDSDFISVDDAKLEVEKYLGHEIDPIKTIKYDVGYLVDPWKNNVLSVGLSSSFFEPLEATSIHNTITQLMLFVSSFLNKEKEHTLNRSNEELYNRLVRQLNTSTLDFLSLHYQGGRDNSDFWKNIKDGNMISDGAREMLNAYKHKIPSPFIYPSMIGSFSMALANWNLAGTNIITREQAYKELVEHNLLEIAEIHYNDFYDFASEKGKYARP